MTEEFPEELPGKAKCPWNENLFKVDMRSPKLNKSKSETFHTFVAKALFLSNRARPDIQPAVSMLSTRVREPTENDWNKLVRMMDFLKRTKDDVLKLYADDFETIRWYVDAAFAVHQDYNSHTGSTMTLGKGAAISSSTKHKVNTRSSTESELVGLDDTVSKILWTKYFLESQGFKPKMNIVYGDNQSTMKMEQNGKQSCGKRTRHFNIKYFYVTDLIERGEIQIKYCPSENMIGDYMTKPLLGAKFEEFRKAVMNL